MKEIYLITVIVANSIFSYSQTGPGGVGNSSSNGLWLRADEIKQANNTAVSDWFDLSGNGNDASQDSIPIQPNYFITSSINGMPVVRLDGSNDEMLVDDDPILDGTSGITFYTVIRPNNLNGSPRGVLGKRITFTDPAEYAYTWFFHGGNSLYLDVNTQNNRFNTGSTTFSNATNYILSWDYDATLAAAQRSSMSTGSTRILRSTESTTPLSASNQDLAIGALNVHYGTYLGADYGEIIHFNHALDTLEHILVQNYLSAKYNIAIAANDIYNEDDGANGDYDFDVAGIGQVTASERIDEAQGSGLVRILSPTNLGDNEFLIWGSDDANLSSSGVLDVPAGIDVRLERDWSASETGEVGTTTVRFDLSDVPGSITTSDLRLLIDADGVYNTGAAIFGPPTSLGAGVYEWTGININDNDHFTVGSINSIQSSLPIELLSFEANLNGDQVDLKWITSTEINNDFFTLEKSIDGQEWEEVITTNGAGNSTQNIEYFEIDYNPAVGMSYYRLKQTDFDGQSEYFNVVPVKYEKNILVNGMINLWPNPLLSGGTLNIEFKDIVEQEVLLVMRDINGREFYSKVILDLDGDKLIGLPIDSSIPSGVYLITASSKNHFYSQRLIIK